MGRLAQTLAITNTSLPPTVEFLMNKPANIQRTAKLRNSLGACSLLALRAVAQSAIPVQQAAAQSAAGRVRSSMPRREAAYKNSYFSDDRSAVKVGPRLINTERSQSFRHLQAQQYKARMHSSVVVALLANSGLNSVSGFPPLRDTVGKVMANQSLNRTHCGRPPFGLLKPSPNASPPQWAG